eukprot:1080222-Amphidinium_carterae.1
MAQLPHASVRVLAVLSRLYTQASITSTPRCHSCWRNVAQCQLTPHNGCTLKARSGDLEDVTCLAFQLAIPCHLGHPAVKSA